MVLRPFTAVNSTNFRDFAFVSPVWEISNVFIKLNFCSGVAPGTIVAFHVELMSSADFSCAMSRMIGGSRGLTGRAQCVAASMAQGDA